MGAGSGEVVARVRRVVTALLLLALVVLAVSGVQLAFGYRPIHSPWSGTAIVGADEERVDAAQALHVWSAVVALGLGAAVLLLAVADALLARGPGLRRAAQPLLAVLGLAALVAGWSTGGLLPWDQVALRAVTVGNDLTGYRFLFDDSSRFAIVDGRDVSIDVLRKAILLHVGAVPTLLVAVAAGWWWSARARRGPVADQAGAPAGSAPERRPVAEIVNH